MTNYICPGCRNSDYKKIKFFFDGHQKLLKCKSCSLIFRIRLETMKEDTDYSGGYLSEKYQNDLINNLNFRKDYKVYILNKVKKIKPDPFEILDIGCSTGSFLNIASEVFPSAQMTGIEPSAGEIRMGKELFKKIIFYHSIYQKNLFESKKFDIIHHSHVIEHIADPLSFLEQNHYHLKKNGILFITYPSARSWYFIRDYFRKNTTGHIIQNQHFNYFTSTSMRNILNKAGFKILEEIYGMTYLKRKNLMYKFSFDPIFKYFKIGEPYFICSKTE